MNDKIELFFERIGRLGTGDRAALKRACGRGLDEADGHAFGVFYKTLPFGVSKWDEDKWFCCACLACLWPTDVTGEPFEECLAKLKEKTSNSFEKRVITLLDTEWSNDNRLALRLYRMAKIMKQKELNPDMASLLNDLCQWNRTDRYVQKKWARAFYQEQKSKEEQTNVD